MSNEHIVTRIVTSVAAGERSHTQPFRVHCIRSLSPVVRFTTTLDIRVLKMTAAIIGALVHLDIYV